jgi:hypothetical protein
MVLKKLDDDFKLIQQMEIKELLEERHKKHCNASPPIVVCIAEVLLSENYRKLTKG